MRRHLFLVSAVILGLFVANGAMADDDDDDRNAGRRTFVGLWQGLDSFDGSTQYLSITCKSRRYCDVRLIDTSFGLSCPNPPQTGFASGKGSIRRNVLHVSLTLFCHDSPKPIGPQENKFVWDRRNNTLLNLNNDLDDPDAPPQAVSNVFHKISR